MKWWLRGVGAVYLLMFVMAAVIRLPIRALGPAGVLDRAAAGDPTASLLVDTWVTLGLEFAGVGVALLIAANFAVQAAPLVWTILGIELVRGIGTDVYMLARGYDSTPHVVWIAVHAIILATGIRCLRREAANENRRAGHDQARAT